MFCHRITTFILDYFNHIRKEVITTNNEHQNDKILAENEAHWADVEDEPEQKENYINADMDEDVVLDERDAD